MFVSDYIGAEISCIVDFSIRHSVHKSWLLRPLSTKDVQFPICMSLEKSTQPRTTTKDCESVKII